MLPERADLSPEPRAEDKKAGPEKNSAGRDDGRKVAEVIAEDDHFKQLEACLRPYFRGGFSWDKVQTGECVESGMRLKKLLLSKEVYRSMREKVAKEFNSTFKGEQYLDPSTLLCSIIKGGIKRGHRRSFENKLYGEIAILVRQVMITWKGVIPRGSDAMLPYALWMPMVYREKRLRTVIMITGLILITE
jgi:hypothetical protein